MLIDPFKGLRATPQSARRVPSVPYDVVDCAEAKVLARGNALSFLHVVRAEIDLPEATDPCSSAVYEKARDNLSALRNAGHLVQDETPCLYAYRMTLAQHRQMGVLACCSVDEYEKGIIKKHELTRRDKEDDRLRHILTVGAQCGPVLITYKDSRPIDELVAEQVDRPALLTCVSEADVQHEVWKISNTRSLVEAFAAVPRAYIADGHHRSASAARACAERRAANPQHSGREEYNFFLAAMFPASQMKILAYNRLAADLGGHTPQRLMELAAEKFTIRQAASPIPSHPKQFCIYLAGQWHELTVKQKYANSRDPIKSLDVSILHEHFIEPLLGIKDVREDKRIGFVGGVRRPEFLQHMVDRGEAAIAFSLHPTSIEQLMAIADAGAIMPPKSTWFEPKLRSGMVVHLI